MRGRTPLETRNSNSWHREETYYYFLIGPLFTKLRPRDCAPRRTILADGHSIYRVYALLSPRLSRIFPPSSNGVDSPYSDDSFLSTIFYLTDKEISNLGSK